LPPAAHALVARRDRGRSHDLVALWQATGYRRVPGRVRRRAEPRRPDNDAAIGEQQGAARGRARRRRRDRAQDLRQEDAVPARGRRSSHRASLRIRCVQQRSQQEAISVARSLRRGRGSSAVHGELLLVVEDRADDPAAYRTRDEGRADVFDDTERFYNAARRHSTLGYLSPVAFENRAKLA
jgi:hypothetical protein